MGWGNLFSRFALILAVGSTPSQAQEFQELIDTLMLTKTGESLIQKAISEWELKGPSQLDQHLKWGPVSRTDSVLVRNFDPKTGTEKRSRIITVNLRKNQSFSAQILDFAHELTHAVNRPSWDPYDPALTLGQYIWSALESPGGEIDAMVSECQVSAELAELKKSGFEPSQRCSRYVSGVSQQIQRNLIKKEFYRVGDWYSEVKTLLQSKGELAKFPDLSETHPALYSSTGRAPYPVALIKEFELLTQEACKNTRNRLKRSPASTEATQFIERRCQVR